MAARDCAIDCAVEAIRVAIAAQHAADCLEKASKQEEKYERNQYENGEHVMAGVGSAIVIGSFILNAAGLTHIAMLNALMAGGFLPVDCRRQRTRFKRRHLSKLAVKYNLFHVE
ncbi:MAG: hypothetical protein ACTTKL_03980 [Treponema sp.]